jgi:antitoxin (DNA-binding transcriptional repressor) of toxin-antitoxin stability system
MRLLHGVALAAGSFKVHCLAVMDEVQSKRETVLITKRGKAVAKLVPADRETDDIFGFLVGKGTIRVTSCRLHFASKTGAISVDSG